MSVLGWTPNSPATVIPQIISRLYVLWVIFPNVPRQIDTSVAVSQYPIIQICCMTWAATEVVRFTYYTFEQVQRGFVGDLRYNMFIVCYPLGVGAELLCMWAARCAVLQIEDPSQRPFTMVMPNKWNFEFSLEYSVYLMYFIYSFGFPQLYMYMISQRAKFYKRRREELSQEKLSQDKMGLNKKPEEINWEEWKDNQDQKAKSKSKNKNKID